jgi:hypothetical protein
MIQQDIKAALCGRLLANRNEAIRFAMYERQRRPQSVIMLPNGLGLGGRLDTEEGSNPTTPRAA